MAFSFLGRTSIGLLVGRTETTLPQSYRFAQRNPGGAGWTVLPNPMVGTSLTSIATVGPNEFIAAGSGMPRFMSWNGSAWGPSANQPPTALVQVYDAASASDREVFLVGSGSAGYVVIRGRR
jgi:hypothetical protein